MNLSKIRNLFLLLLLGSCGLAKMPSSYFSKEMCSCLFVEYNSESYCQEYVKSSIPVWSHSIESKVKEVSSSAFFLGTTYKFVDRKYGCELKE